jgi:hypothetical protein
MNKTNFKPMTRLTQIIIGLFSKGTGALLLSLFILLFIAHACYHESTIPVVTDFKVEVTDNNYAVPVILNITNQTSGANWYRWQIDGGSTYSSTQEDPGIYAGQSEEIAIAAYDGFIGREFFHLTLKTNYVSTYNYLISNGCVPENYLTNPTNLSDDLETFAMSACAFFDLKGCNTQADNDNFEGMMNIVNTADRNRNDKSTLLQKIKNIMNIN